MTGGVVLEPCLSPAPHAADPRQVANALATITIVLKYHIVYEYDRCVYNKWTYLLS